MGMDLSEQDFESEDQSDKEDAIDLEDELIVGGTKLEQKFNSRAGKKIKKEKIIEKDVEPEFDGKSLTHSERIKSILDRFESNADLSLSSASKLLELFRIAMNIDNEQEEQATKTKGKSRKHSHVVKQRAPTESDKITSIVLASSTVLYTRVIKTAIAYLPKIILKSFKSEMDFTDHSEKNYNKLKGIFQKSNQTQIILMKSFVTNFLKLMKVSKDVKLQSTFLPTIVDIGKLVFPFAKFKKLMINMLCSIMCKTYYTIDKANDNSSDVILICFDAIRKIIIFDKFTKDGLVSYTYKKFLNTFGECSNIGGAGSSNAKVRENLKILENCFCELLRIDYISAYMVCFALIRKLANVCKIVRSNPNKKSIQGIINWQYHHNLHLLSVIIYTHNLESEELNLLVYPYVQLCMATLEILLKNTVNFPYTLKVCRMLNIVGTVSKDIFIPIATYILHLFTGKDEYFNRNTKSTKMKLPNYDTALKITQEFFDVKETQE